MRSIRETCPTNDVRSSEFFPDAYNVFRKNRKFNSVEKSLESGVLFAAKSDINCEIVDSFFYEQAYPDTDFFM